MNCVRCGKPALDQEGFCGNCGYKNRTTQRSNRTYESSPMDSAPPPPRSRPLVRGDNIRQQTYSTPPRTSRSAAAGPRRRSVAEGSSATPMLISAVLGLVGILAAVIYTQVSLQSSTAAEEVWMQEMARSIAGAIVWPALRPYLICFGIGCLANWAAWILREKWLVLAAFVLYVMAFLFFYRRWIFVLPATFVSGLHLWQVFGQELLSVIRSYRSR